MASFGPTADFHRARARVVELLERLGLRDELVAHEARFREEDAARAEAHAARSTRR